jgi:hypothetical protein
MVFPAPPPAFFFLSDLPPWLGDLISDRSSFVPHEWQKIRPNSLSYPHF